MDRLGLRGFLGEMQRRGLAKRSAARALSAVRSFYRFLQVHHGLARGGAGRQGARIEKRLPTYLDREQTDALFAWAEARAAGDDFTPTRDLAMLELFYSTGMRLSELAGLNLDDVDLLSDQVKVRGQGAEGADHSGGLAGGAGASALSSSSRDGGRAGPAPTAARCS